MQLRITTTDGVPIYQQIVNQIKYLIASGRLAAGEPLPARAQAGRAAWL